MAYAWTAPSHYLNQCWNIVNCTHGNKLQWNFNRNSNIFIEENTFENVVCEMLFISSRPQCVNSLSHGRFIKESKMWILNENFWQHSLHIFCEILWDWFQWAWVNILFRQWLGTIRVPFYQHGLFLIPVWTSNYMSNEVWVKLLIHSKTSTVPALLKFCHG